MTNFIFNKGINYKKLKNWVAQYLQWLWRLRQTHTAAHLNLMNEYSGKMRDIMAGFPTFMRAQRNFPLSGKLSIFQKDITLRFKTWSKMLLFEKNKIRCKEVVKCSKKRGEKI